MTAIEARHDVEQVYSGPHAELMRWLDEHGRVYEVIDGAVVVNPPPGFAHQDVLGELFVQLRAAAPPGHRVIWFYGFEYVPGSWVEPDIAVLPPGDYVGSLHGVPPILAVEAASPSTRRTDEGRKKEIYGDGGVPTFWLVDPEEPRLRVLELRAGEYVETASVGAGERLEVQQPYPMTVRLPRT